MDKDDILAYLAENLTIDLKFDKYDYGGNNTLKVTIKLDGQEVCTDSCTVEPTEDKGY